MTTFDAAAQIRSLRAQLDVLEARLRASPQSNGHSMAKLRGVLREEAQSTADEIDEARYRGMPEGDE